MRTASLLLLVAIALGLWPRLAAAQSKPWDPALGTAEISGTVKLHGIPPAREPLDMGAEPSCKAHHHGGALTETVIAKPDGSLKNAFVWVKRGLQGWTFSVPSQPVVLDQTGCTYVPHVFGVQAGQGVLIRNSDPVMHNINAIARRNDGFNFAQTAQGMENTRVFTTQEVMLSFKCDVHGWMLAHAGVVAHPFFAVTDENGAFRLAGLPPGEYTIEVWHEKYKTLSQIATVADKEPKRIEFVYGLATTAGPAGSSGGTVGTPSDLHEELIDSTLRPSAPSEESPWKDNLFYWAQAIARWVHVFAAFLWIGQTYLFHRFEHCLVREGPEVGSAIGYVWLIHGGGFFRLEKRAYGKELPTPLLWFKWEALTTWVSGAILITLTYYMGGLMTSADQPYSTAAWSGVGVIVGGFLVYDVLCRTPLGRSVGLMAVIGLAAFMAMAKYLPEVMSTRATYPHIGALIGTIMFANVWMRILPAQRRMLALSQSGEAIPSAMAAVGPQRSRHNSFLVLPLVFLMVSNHYPTISYGHAHSWLIVGVLTLVGWGAAKVLLK